MFKRAAKPITAGAALAFLAMAPASAQLVNGKWQAPPKSGTAGAAAPRQGTEVRHESDGTGVATTTNNGVVPVRVIPAVLMSDGSIMADFGSGLEPVQRACAHSVQRSPLRVVAAGGSTQPAPVLQPAPGMQPAPAQATASQQMSPFGQRTPSQAARSSCHLRDESGHVYATR
jgi:hypothetical protein